MNLYFEYPLGWYVILGMIYVPWLLLLIMRKSYSRKEVGTQLIFGFVTLAISFLIEFVAVNLKVWTYFPGNWPVVLWIAYFGAGLLGYQILKLLEKHKI